MELWSASKSGQTETVRDLLHNQPKIDFYFQEDENVRMNVIMSIEYL